MNELDEVPHHTMVVCCMCGRYGLEEEGDFDQGRYICRACCDLEAAEAEEHLNHMRQVSKEGR